jgi:GNAT superfamily N-acetyltransferase
MDEHGVSLARVAADHADALMLLGHYFDELRRRFEGGYTPPSIEALLRDGATGVTVVCYSGGQPIGCGALRRLDHNTAEVKRMFVLEHARGCGHARRMLRALESAARELACARVVLDTAEPLTEAARLYLREGYREIARYNDNPYAARWFEKRF